MSNISNILLKRRTLKLLSDVSLPINPPDTFTTDIEEIIKNAGTAPFHYPANKISIESNSLKSIAPWRFYILDTKACRDLAKYYTVNNIDGGKIVKMLNCATSLIQCTWIPEENELEFNQKNIEHIAATGAAIQNLLLSATSKDYETYWSSGGTLRESNFKKLLNIPVNEQLLGSIFLFKDIEQENTKSITGAWRNKQGLVNDYSKYVSI